MLAAQPLSRVGEPCAAYPFALVPSGSVDFEPASLVRLRQKGDGKTHTFPQLSLTTGLAA